MSHFYGVLNGARGEATRTGNKSSGLVTHAASSNGAIAVALWHSNGKDYFRVMQVPWHGRGIRETLAEGVVGEASMHKQVTDAILET